MIIKHHKQARLPQAPRITDHHPQAGFIQVNAGSSNLPMAPAVLCGANGYPLLSRANLKASRSCWRNSQRRAWKGCSGMVRLTPRRTLAANSREMVRGES